MERIDLQPNEQVILQPDETIFSIDFIPPGMQICFLDNEENSVYYWTSSRGDKWEKSYGSNYCEAAEQQATRWQQLGYRGPFIVLVGFLANQQNPPTKGEQVLQLRLDIVTSFAVQAVGSSQITE